MKTIKKAQNGVKQKPKPVTGPTFVNFRMANEKTGTGLPGTRQDSLDYKKGWQRGLRGDTPSAMEKKYQGENEYEKMGRWEGQNKGEKNAVKKGKTGLTVKKAKNGKSFPDLNKDGKVTRADILKGRGVIAKKGMAMKKAQTGRKLTPNYSNIRAGGFDYFKTPTAKDSADYRAGFDAKIKNKELKQGDKPSGAKIRGYNEAVKRTKKAKNGTYQPMGKNSRKVGEGKYVSEDGNYKLKFKGGSDTSAPTSAVQRRTLKGFLKGAPKAGFKTKIAKSGTSMKKCKYGCK